MSDRPALRTLFLHPPSFEGFDGGAGSRYQARREIRSFWYPTWLAQPAAMVPGSRLVDAPPDGLTVDQVAPLAREYDLVVLHTSTPSFANDAQVAARLKAEKPGLLVGMVGAHVGTLPSSRSPLRRPSTGSDSESSTMPAPRSRRGSPSRPFPASPTARATESSSRRPARPSRTWTRCPPSWTSTSAT